MQIYSKSWNLLVWFSLLFLFKVVMATLGSLHFHINFRIKLSISTKAHWDFVEPIDQLGKKRHIDISSLLTPVHGIAVYTFRSLIYYLSIHVFIWISAKFL